MKEDCNLIVAKEALNSFKSLTSFIGSDVLNYKSVIKWWEINKLKVESGF